MHICGRAKILRPDEVDIALRRAEIASLQNARDKLFEEGSLPPPVKLAKLSLDSGDEGKRAEAEQTIGADRTERTARWEILSARIAAGELALSQMQDALALGGLPLYREAYVLAPFTYGMMRRAESAHTEVNAKTNVRTVDESERDLELLRAAVKGRYLLEAETDPRVWGLAGWEPGQEMPGAKVLPLADPEEWEPMIVRTLNSRMWSSNGLDPQLARFFRGDRRGAGDD